MINYETIINLIGGAKTRTGLKVKAVLDTNEYETGIKVSAEQFKEIRIRRHKLHPAWNYTISPRPTPAVAGQLSILFINFHLPRLRTWACSGILPKGSCANAA